MRKVWMLIKDEKEFGSMSMAHVTMGLCTLTVKTLPCLATVMLTGSANDRKSTFGGCFFLENNLISWFRKKQNCVALSTAEAEYIAAGSSCSQLI
jgi:hypothetical protein